MTICIVDTSILVELLNVPHLASRHDEVVSEFDQRQAAKEVFLLPLPVLIETGNHIAQNGDGALRRKRAATFVEFARAALAGQSPFVPTPFPDPVQIASWLDDFPAHAMRGIGLADRSLISLWSERRVLHPGRRIYIWSLDVALQSYDTAG